ncbi:MAG TPA: glucoamylase family protein [Prolixibacteraceae bacterium]|nr:glucoamylase family protein [Prolixibacteraceae bacterium]HRV89121.1 glucoamylase family protein [Prolixibacteraceae bacterium]
MKHRLVMVLFFVLPALAARNQEVVFFSEGTTTAYYDQGIVDKANLGASLFEYTYPPGAPQYNDKVPCSTTARKGNSSLKFNYTSAENGNWKVTIFRKDWSAADISAMDTVVFHLYCAEGMPAAALPLIGIRTLRKSGSGEINSPVYALADYNGDVPPGQWTRITFPLAKIRGEAPEELDLEAAKGILFSQSEKNNTARLLYIDEIMAFRDPGALLPVTSLSATGYDSHAELAWAPAEGNLPVRVYASYDGGSHYSVRGETTENHYLDFFPPEGRNTTIRYRVVTLFQERESVAAEAQADSRDFSDEELLDMLQAYTFRYFWEGAHQASGMALERSNGSGTTVASGATGMGLMAMAAAHEREYRPRAEIKARILQILSFLESCDRHHGAWSHWYNGNTKKTQPFSTYDDGGDLVETSFVAQALLTLRNYFSGSDEASRQIREKATQLWREIDWEWYRQGGQNQLFWHWSPNHGFRINMKITGWNECLITYVMAAASPTHPIPAEVYMEGWARSGAMVRKRTYYDREITLSPDWGGPLFWVHYSHLGLDPRGLTDQYADYWQEHVNTVKIHHAYAVANPGGYKNYGAQCWGLTASDDPYGYTAHQPVHNDNGTITPTAALASLPYAPAEALAALKYFYRERGGELWGRFGPYDAFNDQLGWVRKAWLGIDQGPIMVMTENHRSGLLWKLFMRDAEVKAGLEKLGFRHDSLTHLPAPAPEQELMLYPNPCCGDLTITLPQPGMETHIEVYHPGGELLFRERIQGAVTTFTLQCNHWPPGIYFLRIAAGKAIHQEKFIVIR